MKNFVKKIIIITLSFLVSLIVMEGILRILDFEYLNNKIINKDNLYTLKPSSEFVVNRKCFKNIVKTNSLGFHAKEVAIEKPTNVFRIAILGNSFVEANEVILEDTFFSILEKQLNQLPGKKYQYEVLSFGMDSHGTILNKIFAEKYARQFSPDLIIDAFVTSDVDNDVNYSEIEPRSLSKNKIVKFKRMVVNNSFTVQYLLKNYSILKDKLKTSEIGVQNNIDLRRSVHLNTYPVEVAEAWEKESQVIKNFDDFAKANKAKFLIVFIPQNYMFEQKALEEWVEDSGKVKIEDIDLAKPEKKLQQITSNLNIPFVPALDYFKRQTLITGNNPTWDCDGHYNQYGHQLIANILYEYLIKNKDIIN